MQAQQIAERWLTVHQVTDATGVSEETVLRWIAAGELPASNVTAEPYPKRPRWRVSSQALLRFMERRRAVPRSISKPSPAVLRLASGGVIERY